MCSVEVQGRMSTQKLFCVHAEGDSKAEVVARVEQALAELKGGAAPSSAPPAAAPKTGKAPKAAPAAPKATLEDAMKALAALKDGVGGEGDPEKKGVKAIKKLLKEYNATMTKDVPEDKLGELIEKAKKLTPAAVEEEEETEEGDGTEF